MFVEAFKTDWRGVALPPADAALMAFAEKLTRAPGGMREADLRPLRIAGFTDRQISDAVQVIAYFNYINRIADGLGVDLEDFMPPDPREP